MEEEKKNNEGEFDSDEEEEGEQMTEEELSTKLLEACQENQFDDVSYWLENNASPIFKKDNWSPLLWAACNGNEDIVRALLRHNAHSEYVSKPLDD